MPQVVDVEIEAGDSALIIVDMQNEYLRPEGKRFLQRGVTAMNALVPVLHRFRESRSKIIYIQSVRRPDCIQFAVFGVAPKLLLNSWGAEIVHELAPLPGECVVQKQSRDAFNNTTLAQELRAFGLRPGRSQIVIAGVATQGCVDCTVTGFSARDYRVYVPVDCTAAISEELELMGFAHFFGRGYDYNVTPTRSDLIHVVAQPRGDPE